MTNSLNPRVQTQLVTRTKIDWLEKTLVDGIDKGNIKQTVVDCKKDNSQANHYFGEGVYCRSLFIPAGTVVVGHIHKQDRVCIIAQGTCTYVDEYHKETVSAPYIGEFKAGSKTAVYAHTDTLWIACSGSTEKDPDVLVKTLLADTHSDYVSHQKNN